MADKKVVGPKTVYIIVKGDVSEDAVLGAYTNPRDAMGAMDAKQKEIGGRVSFVKFELPKGAPRAPKAA